MAGIECDGAIYHRSAVVRDRDKIRQQILENLGWRILRVWPTDWWYDPESAIAQLDRALHQSLRPMSQEGAVGPAVDNLGSASDKKSGSQRSVTRPDSDTASLPIAADNASTIADVNVAAFANRHVLFARQVVSKERRVYIRAQLGDATRNQNRFFDADYSETLARMAREVLEIQGPILDDALVREIARAHGFARTGNRIKQRVLEFLPNATFTIEAAGRFLWPELVAHESIPFRYHVEEDARRSLNEIAMPELIGLVRENAALASSDDFALALAREIGLARLASSARIRLEEAIAAAERSAG